MSVQQQLEGRHLDFILPVTLSWDARRDVLVETGVEPNAEQIFVVKDLTKLDPPQRARLIDVWEKINVDVNGIEVTTKLGPRVERVDRAEVDAYSWLLRQPSGRWRRSSSSASSSRIERGPSADSAFSEPAGSRDADAE